MQYLWNRLPESEEDVQPASAGVCSVCLEPLKTTNVSITQCGHKFCTTCLLKSLEHKNTCPLCRQEIEPERKPINPISVSIASELIRDEERAIDLTRRITMIQSFGGTNGRSSMIFSLCREIAFSTAHAIARWQKNDDKTYDHSWTSFDYDESDEGSDSE
jgi:hypothetical protein